MPSKDKNSKDKDSKIKDSKDSNVVKLLEQIKPQWEVRNVAEKPIIDAVTFRLHYRVTSSILFTFCVFVTAYTFFGERIKCIGTLGTEKEKEKISMEAIENYCFLGNTYTIREYQNGDSRLAGYGPSEGKERVYHSYYMWIPLMLLLQGILFYLPHWIWKNWESKKIDNLTQNCRGPIMKVDAKQKDMLKSLAMYAADSLHKHNMFALMYYFCEILNFINVIINLYAINVFLGGEFMQYGFDVLKYTDLPQENRTDPMIELFPRITKCDFPLYGPTGTVQILDCLCILPLNNLNEKIYIFLWFWLFALACISILPIVYNVAVFLSPEIRKRELRKHFKMKNKSRIEELAEKTQIGDFFLWNLMARNMNSKCYVEFINELHKGMWGEEMQFITSNDKS